MRKTRVISQTHSARVRINGSCYVTEKESSVVSPFMMFEPQKAFMQVNTLLNSGYTVGGIGFNCGVLPLPKADKTQENYLNVFKSDCSYLVAIPKGANSDGLAGYGTQLLCEASTMSSFFAYAVARSAFFGVEYAPKCVEMFSYIMDNYVYDFGFYCSLGKYRDTLRNIMQYESNVYDRLMGRVQNIAQNDQELDRINSNYAK